jgi:hypothetical protein
MKKYIIIFLLSSIFIIFYFKYKNTQKEQIYRGIKSFYNKNCKKGNCIIKLKDIIKLNWDTVYIIPNSSPEKVYSLKGGDNLLLSEASIPKILFVKKDSIIYQEGFYPDIDFFDFFDKHNNTIRLKVDSVLSLSPNKAKFNINSDDGKLFYLEWIK